MTSIVRKQYLPHVQRYWYLYLGGTFAVLITSLTEVLVPKVVQWVVDLLAHNAVPKIIFFTGSPTQVVHWLGIFLLLLLGLAWLARIAWRETLARATHIAAKEMKAGFWRSLRFQPVHIFHKFPLGDLMSRATGDVNLGRFIFGFTLVLTYDIVFLALLAMGAMLWIDWTLTLLALILFPFMVYPTIKIGQKEFDLHLVAQNRLGRMSDAIAQALASVRLQRATASEGVWQRRLRFEADFYARRRFHELWTGWKVYPIGGITSLVAYAVLLVVGIRRVEAELLSVGELVALQSYVFLLQATLLQVGDCLAEWQRGFASLRRVDEVVSLVPQRHGVVNDKQAITDQVPIFEFDHLSFTYPYSKREVLHDLTLKIYAGERIGFMGPIGAGKSTILDLMTGLLNPLKGQLKIAGQDALALTRADFTKLVTYVAQRPFLFAASIKANLELDQQFNDAEIWEVLDAVQLANDVRDLPGQLDAQLGEWGINLSGGQKQRMTLARALLRPQPILVLDDCLSAVDVVNEEKILQRIDQYLKGSTIVWAAHRRSTLKLCHRIFHIENGEVQYVEQ